MRNLVLILIAFIAVVTFIRAVDMPVDGAGEEKSRAITEFGIDRERLRPADFEAPDLGAEPVSPPSAFFR
jgi:hypothetical protein